MHCCIRVNDKNISIYFRNKKTQYCFSKKLFVSHISTYCLICLTRWHAHIHRCVCPFVDLRQYVGLGSSIHSDMSMSWHVNDISMTWRINVMTCQWHANDMPMSWHVNDMSMTWHVNEMPWQCHVNVMTCQRHVNDRSVTCHANVMTCQWHDMSMTWLVNVMICLVKVMMTLTWTF